MSDSKPEVHTYKVLIKHVRYFSVDVEIEGPVPKNDLEKAIDYSIEIERIGLQKAREELNGVGLGILTVHEFEMPDYGDCPHDSWRPTPQGATCTKCGTRRTVLAGESWL